MSTDNMTGKYFTIKGIVLDIGPGLCFGYISDTGNWAIYLPGTDLLGLGWAVEHTPRDTVEKILGFIAEDTEAGKDHLIHHIGVNQEAFVELWCAGAITRDHFKTVVETDYYIQVEGVMFDGKPYIVRMYPDSDYKYATYDVAGEVV